MRMRIKQQKPSKEERAVLEQRIVVDCYNKMSGKIDVEEEKIDKAQSVLERAEKEILLAQEMGVDERTLEKMLEEIERIEMEKSNSEFLSDTFSGVKKVLFDLRLQVDVLMSLGWHEYVVKSIPEKKLHRMISLEKPEEMRKLTKIVEKIMAKIEDRVGRSSFMKEQYDKRLQHLREVRNQLYEMKQEGKRSNMNSRLNEIREKLNKASTGSVLPIPATNDNVATGKVQNVVKNN